MSEEKDTYIESIARELRAHRPFGDDFTARVMAAVASEPAPVLKRRPNTFLQRFVLPRQVTLSPLAAFACALLLFAAGAAISARRSSQERLARATVLTPATYGRDTVRVVQFVFVAPDARHVALVGDFNNWDKKRTPLKREGGDGLWTVSIPLPHGRHQYAFMVDGHRWMLDPSAPKSVENSYGTPNSVVTVTADAL